MKKVLLLALALIMVLSAFVACNPSDDTPVETTKKPSSNASTPKEQIGNLDPSIDLNEKEISILSRSHQWFADEVSVEKNEGDPIDNAIYTRNLAVEQLLNCTIKNYPVLETGIDPDYCVITELQKTQGPDCPYDILSASAYTAFQYTASGLCLNLREVNHIDLEQDYWAPYFNDQASIGGEQYYATGAISLSLRRMIFVTFFNTKLAEQYRIDNLYDVVKDGNWTLDYQAEILSGVWSNMDALTGPSEGDFFGLVTGAYTSVDPYWTGCDVNILVKNEEDFFEFEPELEKLDAVLKKIKEVYAKSHTWAYDTRNDTDQEMIRTKFANEEAMMATLRLIEIETDEIRNMSKYGILPMPKFDQAQKEYYSHAHDQFTVYGIVSSKIEDSDELGAFLEAMAIESYRTVTPAYFELALKGKYSKDPESWEMLDKIVNNLKINGGLLYTLNLNHLSHKLRLSVADNSPTISGTIFNAPMLVVLKNKLKNLQDSIQKMQDA